MMKHAFNSIGDARRMGRLVIGALALFGVLLSGAAYAQNATNGETLYGKVIVTGTKSCLVCHGTPQEDPVIIRGANAAATKAATVNQSRMTPLNGKLTDSDYNDLAAYIGKTLGTAPTYIAVSATPSVSVSTTALTFASQNVNTTSAAQTVTVSNAAGATGALNISALSTTSGSDFAVSGGSCSAGGSVAVGASCTVNVTFKPLATGTRNGTLTIAHNGANGKSDVSLSGVAVNTSPAVSVSPTALTFSSVVATASSPMRVTVSNTGTGTLSLSTLTLGGGQAADYSLAGSSTCAANGNVAGGSSCVIDVLFTPGAAGSRAATLTIAHNAAGSPSTVTLSGTGTAVAQPGIALDSTSIDLGQQVVAATSAAKTLTLTNSGGAALNINTISTSGTDSSDFVLGGTCTAGTSVAAKGTCTITVAMKPVTLGAKTATLNIASNAPTGTATVSLRGTSVNTPAPQVGLSQAAVGFGTVTFGVKSMPRTVTLTNTGTAAMTVSSVVSTSTEFVVTHDCPASLAVSASCTLSIVYTPVAANAAEAIVITTNAVSSPNSIVVTGLGTMASMPVLAWQPSATALNFASTVVGVSSASQSLTLLNQGPGAVMLNSLGVAGTDTTAFAIAAASTCKAGLSLAANATCTVAISFVPGSTGSKTANLQIGSNGTPPGDIALSGTGASPSSGTGTLTVSQTTLDYSSIAVVTGQTSAPLTLGVSNGSAAAVTISSIKVSGPFAMTTASSNSCPATSSSLAPGASCNLAVVYAPTTAGASTGTLTIVTSSNQTIEVALRGQASAATPKLSWQSNSTSLTFSSTLVGAASASQTLTLSNQGPGTATVSAVNLTGSDASAFAISSSSTCKANAMLNSGATCTVVLSFAPATAGSKSATLRIESNATAPGDVVLSGTGMANVPSNGTLSIDKSQLDFSATSVNLGQASAPMSVVVSNGNVAAVTIAKVELSGPFKFSNNGCQATSSLAVNASCTIAVAYAPTSTGTATGNLMLTTGTNQVLVVSLKGLSNPPAPPVLAWQSAGVSTLQFDATEVGKTSASKSLTMINQGPGAASFTAIEADGADETSFVVAAGTTCLTSAPLAQGATCVVNIGFAPSSAGTKNASLRIASNAAAPATVTLNGIGSAPNGGGGNGAGVLAVDNTSLSFMAGNGRSSMVSSVRVTNSGTAALTIANIGTSGPFQVVNSAADGCGNPHTLAAGGSCNLSVIFTAPSKAGDSTGTLTIQSATGDSKVLALSGHSVVTNVGSSGNGDEEGGGGALGPWWLAMLALAVVVTARVRQTVSHH